MNDPAHRIGFMQGRLSPQIDGKIQAFPWPYWRDEFPLARDLGFTRLEWTLDHDDLAANPLMTAEGQAEILALSAAHGVAVSSITGDCFMQAPFW
jgi:hexulose-6-phosphate isomerase